MLQVTYVLDDMGNLPVNWPKLLVSFQNDFTNLFDVYHHYMFGMSFYEL